MISPERAREIILNEVKMLSSTQINILESLGHILAEDVLSKVDIPPFDNSAMDGFAIKVNDVRGATSNSPKELNITGDLPAGRLRKVRVSPGQAVAISTGAALPKEADAVVRLEDCKVEGTKVKVFKQIKKGANIRLEGEDISKGDIVARSGQAICPAEVGLFASLGMGKVPVIRGPKVAIISTGSELVELGKSLAAGEIRDSNSYTLAAQITSCGAKPKRLGIAGDTEDEIREKLTEGLKYDVVITTGGVSVGEHDLVKEVLAELKADLRFWRVAQKPGKPFAFWMLKDKPVFGFPGNPVALMICFEEYVRPAILKMMGKEKLFRPETDAILEHDVTKKPDRMHYLRVELTKRGGKYYAKSTGPQGSGILTSMSKADGLAIFPKGKTLLKKGEKIKVNLINLKEDH